MRVNDGVALGDLEAVMREAGALALKTARGPFKRWTKGDDNSPVSDGDIAVNDLLRARLTRLAPEAGWLSEETEDSLAARAASSAWIVDPIDGTRAYLAGFPDWTVSVALVEDGRPLIAALYAPVTDEMFLARRVGGGSYQAASDPRLHFGLADARRVESVEVRWPSGRIDRFGPLEADTAYRLVEGSKAARPIEGWRP